MNREEYRRLSEYKLLYRNVLRGNIILSDKNRELKEEIEELKSKIMRLEGELEYERENRKRDKEIR